MDSVTIALFQARVEAPDGSRKEIRAHHPGQHELPACKRSTTWKSPLAAEIPALKFAMSRNADVVSAEGRFSHSMRSASTIT